jgi:hypothetical protein
MGIQYMLDSPTQKHLEFGVDLHSEHKLFVNGGYKYVFNSTEIVRPYLKAGVNLRFDAGDRLETPSDLDSYSVLLAAGAEDLMVYDQSLRIDIEFYIGGSEFMSVLAVGYSFGW